MTYGDPPGTYGISGCPMGYCPYCGLYTYHVGVCPRVQSIEYHANGTVKKVSFHPQPTINPWPSGYPSSLSGGTSGGGNGWNTDGGGWA